MTTGSPLRPAPRQSRDLAELAIILTCACIAVVPLLMRGNSFGHDFDFHLLSWMEVAKQWHQGVLYPHWLPSANYGAGEPRFVFYPPASWMLGALLGTLTNWTLAPVLFILTSLFFAGVSFRYLAREWMPNDFAGMAACLYVVNPYAIFNAYERSAYGELLAGVWMPLILLFALRRRSSIVALALSIAAVWLTNAPAGVMACYAVGGLAIATYVVERSPWPVIRATCGGLLGIGIASFYLVPAAYQRRWVEIARAVGPGMRVEDSFLFAGGGDAFHVAVLRTASWIAVLLLTLAGVATGILWTRHRKSQSDEALRLTRACILITLAVLLLLLPLSGAVWKFAPELKFLQFPWRWLLLQSAATALLLGLAAESFLGGRSRHRWMTGLALIMFAGLAVYAETSAFYQFEDEDDTLASQLANYSSGAGVEGTDEYTPVDADNSAIQKNLPMVRLLNSYADDGPIRFHEANPAYQPDEKALPGKVIVEKWQSEHVIVRATTGAPAFAVLRLMDYPGWRVMVNGRVQAERLRRDDGLIVVALPGGAARIEVAWRPTRDVIWGRVVACLSLFSLLPAAWLDRRNQQNTQV